MNDVLFLGGIFAKENEAEIIRNSKASVEYSANLFQEKLISGFKENGIDLRIVSAPFIGAYPTSYKKAFFNGFRQLQNEYEYVKFNNIWGIRNFSRARALKIAVASFIAASEETKLIVVYSPHTPFIEASVYAKKKYRNVKICLVVPDLPQYMNLNENRSIIYDFFKCIDIRYMNSLLEHVDGFVLLTEPMKDILHVGNRPYLVVEGLVDESAINKSTKKGLNEKYIVYAGKMNYKFGVKALVDAFHLIRGKNYKLILCGTGDAFDYTLDASRIDNRIICKGQVTASEAHVWIQMADVLVNPRPNNEAYTKYSFPSKIIEYLLSGNPVVAYMLDGVKEVYRDFIYEITENSAEGIKSAIMKALTDSQENKVQRSNAAIGYLRENCSCQRVAEKIIEMGS